jgi:ArsR family transcriptional regulator
MLCGMKTAANPELAADAFRVLSDPTRLRILERLRHGERCVCELMDLLDAAQSRLSFHLRVLKEAGLVTDRRDGRWVHYTLVPGALEEAEAFLHQLAKAQPLPLASTRGGCCD